MACVHTEIYRIYIHYDYKYEFIFLRILIFIKKEIKMLNKKKKLMCISFIFAIILQFYFTVIKVVREIF